MADKPTSSAFRDGARTLSLLPPAPGGVDLFVHAALLPPGFLRQSENVRLANGALSRRPGEIKIYRASSPCGSKTFGAIAKYATIPAASQLLLPAGGWAFHFSVEATRGASAAQLVHGQDGADAAPPLDVSLSTGGVLTAKVNWDGGGSDSVASAALTDASVQNGLFLHDGPAGTLTLYLNGSSVGTPVTGLATTKRPVQTASMAWLVGVKKTAAAVVTLPWIGKVDSLTLFSLAGARPSSGSTTLAATLLKHSRRQWPTPQMDCVRFNYDMDAAGVMTDSSLYANNAAFTGAVSDSAAVAFDSIMANFVGAFDANDGSRVNVFISAGRLFYQTVRA